MCTTCVQKGQFVWLEETSTDNCTCMRRYGLDNCSIDHAYVDKILMFRLTGIVMFLPQYCPDYNPVEGAFSYVKY